MWNDDGGTGSELTYKNIPFFITSAGYGVFIPTSSFVSLEIQSERTTRINISVPGETLGIYLIHGPNPKSILQTYGKITGVPALPPAWTFGLWLSTSFTTDYDENTVNSFLEGMEKRDIPVSVFHFEYVSPRYIWRVSQQSFCLKNYSGSVSKQPPWCLSIPWRSLKKCLTQPTSVFSLRF